MRDHRRGIILLSTLLSVLLLISLAAVIQQKVTSNLIVMTRLQQDIASSAAEGAIRERLRAILGDVASGLPVDIDGFNVAGTPFIMAFEGRSYQVQVNDVDGLVDTYLGSPGILAILPSSAAFDLNAQQAALQSLPSGTRYPVLDATLARAGLDRAQRLSARAFVTQSSENGQLRVETTPEQIRVAASALSPLEIKVGQMVRFHITIQEVSER